MSQTKNRKVWVDWMKTLGMLTIIWGHCFPDGMSAFVYAFNVPVFFLISGYLTHQETSMKVCFEKTLHNLIIPYFILAFIKAAGYMFAHLSDGQWLWSVLAILGGFHQLHDAYGCSNLWFVYTLILIKFIYQLLPNHRLLLSCLCIGGAVVYNQYESDLAWSAVNVLVALPFFMLGNYIASQKRFEEINGRLMSMNWGLWMLLLVVCIALTYIISDWNDTAKMYEGHYGESLWLFSLASLTGSAIIYLLSVRLNGIDWKWVRISSLGSIVTLVFHRELLHTPIKLVKDSDMDIFSANLLLFLSSAIVLIAFVPIIMIVKRVFPVVLGRRAKNI